MANYRRNIVHTAVPESIGDYYHNTVKSNWGIYVPAKYDLINHATNPSFELAGATGLNSGEWVDPTTDLAIVAPAAFATRTTAQAYSGSYSLNVGAGRIRMAQPNSIYLALYASNTITAKAYMRAVAGSTISISLSPYVGTNPAVTNTYIATGLWQEVKVTTTTASTFPLFVTFYSTSNYYIDAVSYYHGDGYYDLDYYFDGNYIDDFNGSVATWDGTPNASRSRFTRFHSSLVSHVNLSDIGFDVFSYTGAGMPDANISQTPYALMNGSFYQRTMLTGRTITLVGTFSGETESDVQRSREKMMSYIFPYHYTQEQRELLLTYEMVDNCGDSISDRICLPVVYSGGLDGNVSNLYVNRVPVQFVSAGSPVWVNENVVSEYSSSNWIEIEYNGTTPTPVSISINVIGAFWGSTTWVESIANITTGQSIKFTRIISNGVQIPSYGTLFMRTDPMNLLAKLKPSGSSILGELSPDTIPANFVLVPGKNVLNIQSTIPVEFTIKYQERHYGVDGIAKHRSMSN